MNVCHLGDCRDVMRSLIADGVRVQTCVTSPPYFGLRDYGVDGQIGLEASPVEFVDVMVDVFRLVRELLADDGTLWLNLGDSYAGSWGAQGRPQGDGEMAGRSVTSARQIASHPRFGGLTGTRGKEIGLKPKDLMGIPWRVAFALQADGWYLRQDIIWSKPNPMPESVTDRCTKAHEYLFLLSKSERYFFDYDAMQEPCDSGPSDVRKMLESKERIGGKHLDSDDPLLKASGLTNIGQKRAVGGRSGNKERKPATERGCPQDGVAGSVPWEGLTRNKRSVWNVATVPFSGAHFATFPPALIEPCILAGSRPNDIVFDPFMGSGTVGQVAQDLGRRWLGAELNPDYLTLQAKRTAQQGMVFA